MMKKADNSKLVGVMFNEEENFRSSRRGAVVNESD